jgi:hypothetical protein
MSARDWFELIFPFLFITWGVTALARRTGLQKKAGRSMIPAVLIVSGVISFTPIQGLSLADYILSANPLFSIGSMCLFAALVWKQFGGRPLLSGTDLLLFSTWNITVSLYVYLSYLGFIGYDLYYLGYGFSPLFVVTAIVTIVLLVFRSPVSWIFIAYIVAYIMKLIHSNNYFDYITDVPLCGISLAILTTYIVKSIISMRRHNKAEGSA